MFKLIFTIVLLLLSCDETNQTQGGREDKSPSCEDAIDHIYECKGYRPYLVNCTSRVATKIVNMTCDELESYLP